MQTVFFVTKLSTTGGLLRRKNVTLLIVTEDEKVPKVLEIIKNNSGERKTLSYINTASMPDRYGISSFPMVPVNIQTGGSTVFYLKRRTVREILTGNPPLVSL